MGSTALATWAGDAQVKLDELGQIHRAATGGGPGRRWGTTQLNRSLLVALVAQFQRYCRDLHDDAVAVHVAQASPQQGPVLRLLLKQGRKLDSGNPRKGHLGADFGRLGFTFIGAVKAADADAEIQLDLLEQLVDYRNAVVHSNDSELTALETTGPFRPTLGSFNDCRRNLSLLAVTIDGVVSLELAKLLSIANPW